MYSTTGHMIYTKTREMITMLILSREHLIKILNKLNDYLKTDRAVTVVIKCHKHIMSIHAGICNSTK
jgi:hypothetical protein